MSGGSKHGIRQSPSAQIQFIALPSTFRRAAAAAAATAAALSLTHG